MDSGAEPWCDVHYIRLPWDAIAHGRAGTYDWSVLDQMINNAWRSGKQSSFAFTAFQPGLDTSNYTQAIPQWCIDANL